MAVLKNRAGMTTATVGTGTITLGAAIAANAPLNAPAWQSFTQAGAQTGEVLRYLILDKNGNWEYGPGSYVA